MVRTPIRRRSVLSAAGAVLFAGVVLHLLHAQPPAQAQGRGVRVSVPLGWKFDSELAADAGPVALKNFAGEYIRGGILPPGGADITITSDAAPVSLTDLLNRETEGSADVRSAETAVLNSPAMMVSSVDSFAAQLSIATQAYYVLHGSKVYKFYLSYRAGDPNAGALASVFQQIISTTQFTE